MKQIVQKLCIVIAMLGLSSTMYAYDFEVDGIYYNKLWDGKSVEVTFKDYNYNSYSGSVSIPSQVNYSGTTYSVISIRWNAFYECSSLTSVNIPNSVTEIGAQAFYKCTGLTSVTIPNSVTSIGGYAFYGCSGLTSVTIGNSVKTISHYVFSDCSGLTSVTIPNSVTEIDAHIFTGCIGLEEIIVDNGNTVYDSRDNCNAIIETTTNTLIVGCKTTVIPNSVTDIGYEAFAYCSGLTSVTIPNSVTSIGGWAFSGCIGLEEIIVDNGNTVYDSRDNCNAIIETTTNTLIVGCKNTVIPNSVTSIGGSAFWGCTSLTSVTIPNSVTSIGNFAFYFCSGLSSVTIPNSVTSIGNSTFLYCTGLTSVNIGNSVTEIGGYAFAECTGLTSVTIPNSVKEIGVAAFSSCSGLTSVTIPNSVTSIGESAFSYCSGLTSVAIPSTVTSIGNNAFARCVALGDFTIEDGENVLTLGSNGSLPLFVDCPLDEVYIGRKLSYDTAAERGYSPFYRNTSLRTVEITDAETQICDNEFYGCTNLQSLKIGDGVTTIGKWAFSGCSALEYFSVGSMVESIGEEAFSDCIGLTRFTTDALTPPTCGNQALDDINKRECTLYVPMESRELYSAADQWKEFFFISGIEDIVVDADTSEQPVEYYNLQGIHIENPTTGVYIRRQGSSTTKVSIK